MSGLFVGLNTIDIQFLVNEYPESNTKTIVSRNGVYLGGPATNAAITFSKLGGESTLLTSIGNHFLSKYSVDKLGEFNIKLLDISENKNIQPIISSVITSDKTGDRTIVTFDPENITNGFNSAKNLLSSIHRKILSSNNIILLDGFFIDIATDIAKAAKEYSIQVVLDGGSWKNGMEDLIEFADIAICSENFYPPGTKNEEDVFEYLSLRKCEKIAITRGHRAILYKDKSEYNKIPVNKINAVDTLGAGDILHGAFCYYYLKTQNFAEALGNASNIATESCKYIGPREWKD